MPSYMTKFKHHFQVTLKNLISKHATAMIMISFLAIALLSVLPYYTSGYFYVHIDGTFHIARIQELVSDYKQGTFFPEIATHTFNSIGDIVPSCYPYFMFYPVVLLFLLFKPVEALYLGMVLIIFGTLAIAYFSLRLISTTKMTSTYFGLLYGLNIYVFIELFYLNHIGEMLAYMFFPLVVSSIYLVMFKNFRKWYWLVFGLTGVAYSHLVSLLVIGLFIVIFYFSFLHAEKKGERLKRFWYLCLVGITTTLLSLPVIVPLMTATLQSKLGLPVGLPMAKDSVNLGNLLTESLTNDVAILQNNTVCTIGPILILIIIFGWAFLKKVSKFTRYVYLIALAILYFASDLFPWQFFDNTPVLNLIDKIQGTRRFVPLIVLFISIFGAYLIQYILKDLNERKLKPLFIFGILSFVVVLAFNTFNLSNNFEPFGEMNYKITNYNRFPSQTYIGSSFPYPAYKFNNFQYRNQFPAMSFAPGDFDYVPFKSFKILRSVQFKSAILNHKKFTIADKSIHPLGNGIKYTLNIPMTRGTKLDLPFLKYNNLKYLVYFNGKPIRNVIKSSRHTIEFTVPKKAKSATIVVMDEGSLLNKISFVIGGLAWVLLLGFLAFRRGRL